MWDQKKLLVFVFAKMGVQGKQSEKRDELVEEEDGRRDGVPSERCERALIFINSCKNT